MAEKGLTPQGFNRKLLAEIKAEIDADLRATFGPAINLLPESVFGQVVGVFADREDQLWKLAEAVYHSQYRETARGVSLDYAVGLTGVVRQRATKSTVTIRCSGTVATVLPAGRVVSVTGAGDLFTSLADATIGGGGYVDVEFEAEQLGPVQALAGTLTTIETPVGGWASCTNVLDAALGRNVETDEDLIRRADQSLQIGGAGTVDAMKARLRQLSGVTFATVVENFTDVTDVDGRPPHSIECIVSGGIDAEIAQEIWDSRPAGIRLVGSTTTSATDIDGATQSVNFSRPTQQLVWLEVDVTRAGAGEQPSWVPGAEVPLAAALLALGDGYAVGQDVVLGQFSALAFQTQGVVAVAVRAKIGAPPGGGDTVNLAVGSTSIAVFDSSRITVVVI